MISRPELSSLNALVYEHTCAALESALDLMGRPLFLFSSDTKLFRMNSEARLLVSSKDGLTVCEGRLEADRRTDTAALRQALRNALASPPGRQSAEPAFVEVNRPSGRRPFILRIAQLASGILPSEDDPQSLVGIVVIDLDASPRNLDQVLRELLGLTAAEVRLANALLRGDDLTEAADRFRVSRNTVRSQLQSIFGKTGTSRQGELVRLLTQLTM